MTGPTWVRLDNASNIFLAARTESDPKVFRLSVDVDHEVDRELLQAALDATYERYPLYRAVLRRGVFWYYLQDSDLHPVVTANDEYACAPIYEPDRRTLLFRVTHRRERIILEVFHALSDGTGALWFFTDLVSAYIRLRFPGRNLHDDSLPTDPIASREIGEGAKTESVHELVPDSFAHYFRRRPREETPVEDSEFSLAAAPATMDAGADDEDSDDPDTAETPAERRAAHPPQKVYRVKGTRTPDFRTRVVELSMPVRDMLGLARAEGVSLTMYLTAVFFESIRLSSDGLGDARTIAASVPVNLRQFFPSTSARNFFATVQVDHTYGDAAEELGAVCRQLDRQFRPKTSPDALEKRLRQLVRLERMPFLRILPRPLKDVILKLVNWNNNRGLTVALSNLGRVQFPESVREHIGGMQFHVTAARPQFCSITHAGVLTVSFSSPFVETGHVREFARLLTARGVPITVAAERVTEEELAEVAL